MPSENCAKKGGHVTQRRRTTLGELESRRSEALRLRFAGESESRIAERLGVSVATISRDLRATRESLSREFNDAEFARHEIASAVSLFTFLENAAVRELLRLDADPSATNAKVKCILAAHTMRLARLEALAAVGLITMSLPSPNSLPRAAKIREMFVTVRNEQRDLMSAEERRWRHLPEAEASGRCSSKHVSGSS
jgi:hypothetical protein